MFINYYKSYIRTIHNSIGSKIFTEFYINDTDILHTGAVACAYFVSNILKQFNLTPAGRANVVRVVEDLKIKWRTELSLDTPADQIPAWSVLVWEWSYWETYGKIHHHIWFYVWDEKAISNNSIHFTGMESEGYVPVEHHYTYENQRALTHIFSRDWNNPFADCLYHHEIDVKHICAVGDEKLAQQWLDTEEIIIRSGQKEWLQYGKLCGAACVAMAVQYFNTNPVTLKECIAYADTPVTYYDTKRNIEKTVTCYVAGIGRYHSGLIHMASQLANKHDITIQWSVREIARDSFLELVQECLKKNIAWEKNCIIASVTLWFDTSKEKKWGHLVLVAGLDYNGNEHSILVHDPIEHTKKQIPLIQFMESFSGNYIILEKKE